MAIANSARQVPCNEFYSIGRVERYMIAQETLTNIVKHTQASKAVVSVFPDILKIYLTIEDDGVGFNQKKTQIQAMDFIL